MGPPIRLAVAPCHHHDPRPPAQPRRPPTPAISIRSRRKLLNDSQTARSACLTCYPDQSGVLAGLLGRAIAKRGGVSRSAGRGGGCRPSPALVSLGVLGSALGLAVALSAVWFPVANVGQPVAAPLLVVAWPVAAAFWAASWMRFPRKPGWAYVAALTVTLGATFVGLIVGVKGSRSNKSRFPMELD